MSYLIGDTPSLGSSVSEIADYLEIECLRSIGGCFSVVEAAQLMGVVDDESTPEDEREENREDIRQALAIVEDRERMCRGAYPFSADVNAIYLKRECDSIVSSVYTFFLLATRERMKEDRFVGKIDGSLLFERVCADILKNFFGKYSSSFVFGTGGNVPGNFKKKLEELLRLFSERGYTISEKAINPHLRDGGIDIVTFIPFNDSRQGQFITFSQCKTGTNWEQMLSSLCPSILDDYMNPSLVSKPFVLFLIAEDCRDDDWVTKVRRTGGVIFDRCRLMSFLPESLDEKLLNDIMRWNTGVINRYNDA